MKHFHLLVIATIALLTSITLSSKHTPNYRNSLTMLNVEALADSEEISGAAEKIERDKSEGPYTDNIGRPFYIIHHFVDCFGSGEIECSPSYSFEIKYF